MLGSYAKQSISQPALQHTPTSVRADKTHGPHHTKGLIVRIKAAVFGLLSTQQYPSNYKLVCTNITGVKY